MTDDLDINEILSRTETDFKFAFSFDVSKMQSLFEKLCLNVFNLQKEIVLLRKEIRNKAEKESLEPIKDNIARNNENVGDLIDRIDDIKSLVTDKLGPLVSSRSQASRASKPTSRDIQHTNPDEGTFNSTLADAADGSSVQKRKASDRAPSLSGRGGNLPNEGPISYSTVQDLIKRINICEDKIDEFDDRLGKIQKSGGLSNIGGKTGSKASETPSRKQKFKDFLDELDATPSKGGKGGKVEPIKSIGKATKSPIVSPGRQGSSNSKKSGQVSPKHSNLQSPKLSDLSSKDDENSENVSKDNREDNKYNTSENNNNNNYDSESNENDEDSKSKSKNSAPARNGEDLLETFIDAAKIEIENVKKSLVNDLNNQLKDNNMKINGSISKTAAASEIGLKKANGRIIDSEAKLMNDIKSLNADSQKNFKQFHIDLATLTDLVKTLEQRIESSTKAAEMTKDSLKNIVNDDGKIDTQKLLEQLQSHLILINDMDGRVVALENKEYVYPEAFNSAIESIAQIGEKLGQIESMAVSTDMKLSELHEIQNELKSQIGNQVSHEQLLEVEHVLHDVSDENANLRDALVKCNKDIINARAAISTLRSHSEESHTILDEIREASNHAVEDAANNEKRIKKMLAFIQNETSELSGQIKDLGAQIDRNEESINDVQRQRTLDLVKINAQNLPRDPSIDNEDGTSRSTTSETSNSVRTLNGRKISPENVAEATSPHLQSPPIDDAALLPVQENRREDDPNIITLPEKYIYEQPVVTIVRKKQIEVVESQQVRRGNLPRLSSAQTRRDVDNLRTDLRRYEDLIPRIDRTENSIQSLRSAVDQLNRNMKSVIENKAEKSELQSLFEQFRMALGELNNRLGGLRKNMAAKADIDEVRDIQKSVLRELMSSGETAAGTETIRCLMCGQSKTNITGAIDDPTLAKAIGNAVSSRVCGADGEGNVCFVYGDHGEMYFGRSADGKPKYSKQVSFADSKNTTTSDNSVNESHQKQTPMTAPMLARKILEIPAPNT